MFSKVNGNVDLYPKQTIARESPTKTRSASDCSAKEPEIQSHAVNAIIFCDLSLYLMRSEGNIGTHVSFLIKNC